MTGLGGTKPRRLDWAGKATTSVGWRSCIAVNLLEAGLVATTDKSRAPPVQGQLGGERKRAVSSRIIPGHYPSLDLIHPVSGPPCRFMFSASSADQKLQLLHCVPEIDAC